MCLKWQKENPMRGWTNKEREGRFCMDSEYTLWLQIVFKTKQFKYSQLCNMQVKSLLTLIFRLEGRGGSNTIFHSPDVVPCKTFLM